MEALEKAIAMISAASGADTTAVAERLESDATAEAIATEFFEPKYKAQRDQGHKIATDKTRKAVETALKAAGVDDASFDALPAAIETLQSKAASASPGALTAEQLLKQKPVVDALNAERLKTESAVAEAVKATEGRLSKEQKDFYKLRVDTAKRDEAKRLLKELNPNYTPGKETAQEERLLDEIIRKATAQLDEKGNLQLLEEDGSLKVGKLGNGLAKYSDLVRDIADDAYGLPVSNPRAAAGLTQEQADAAAAAAGFTHYKGAAPATAQEYEQLANDPNLPIPALQELQAFWKTKQAA